MPTIPTETLTELREMMEVKGLKANTKNLLFRMVNGKRLWSEDELGLIMKHLRQEIHDHELDMLEKQIERDTAKGKEFNIDEDLMQTIEETRDERKYRWRRDLHTKK